MKLIIHSFVFLIPFYSIGLFIGGKYISITHMAALFLAFITLLIVFEGKMKWAHVAWTKYFLGFLAVSALSLLTSRYGLSVFVKGMIQIAGILVMLAMSVLIVRYIQMKPERLYQVVRVMMFSVGLMAVVGIVQFIFFNVLPYPSVGSFGFLNSLAGGTVWSDPGYIGPIYRVNSFAAEPTHFARFLCLGLGLALIRVGFLGKIFQQKIKNVVPMWIAGSIILGVLLSVSVNGWLMFIFVALALHLLIRRVSIRSMFKIGLSMVFVFTFLISMMLSTGDAFMNKLLTLSQIIDDSNVDARDNANLSALAVVSNIDVSLKSVTTSPFLGGGIGSHSMSYQQYAPSYVTQSKILDGLNADDAASLLFRLLSETGLVGTILFLFALVYVIFQGRRVIMSYLNKRNLEVNVVITIGLLASCVGIFEIYLTRTGHYYDPSFWIIIALVVASVHQLIKERFNT